MNTQAAATIVVILLAFSLAAVIWQASRALRHASEQVDHILDTPRTGHIPAAPDNEPGIHLADHDECELLWSMPAFGPDDPDLNAGRDQMWAAIRDEQQKGEA